MQAPHILLNLWKTQQVAIISLLQLVLLLLPWNTAGAATIALPAISIPVPSSQHASIALPTITLPAASQQAPVAQQEPLLPRLEQATVHIVCAAREGNHVRYVSGTGVIIDPRGIILTNAHILALATSPKAKTTCTAQMGSPSRSPISITTVYMSPQWVKAYGPQITSETLQGTGEHDVAIALFSNATDLKKPYTSINLPQDQSTLKPKSEVLACSYPAEFLGGEIVSTSLYRNCSFITTGEGFTFSKKNTFDAISLGGTILARAGSSGGPIITLDGRLAGIITTSSKETETSRRILTAVTIGYIDRFFVDNTKESLAAFVKKPIHELILHGKNQALSLQTYF